MKHLSHRFYPVLPLLLWGVLSAAFSVKSMAAPGDILFSDNFERATLGADWTVNNFGGTGNAGIGTFTANSPTRSLYTRWDQVTVTSKTFDLSAAAAAELSLWVRVGSDAFSEDPENPGTEDLMVEYLSSAGTWNSLARYVGGGTPGQIFSPTLSLPTDALHANFQFRFQQTGGHGQFACTSSTIGCDYYHIDDVTLTETAPLPPIVGGFCDDFESGLSNWIITSTGGGTAGINTGTFNSAVNNSLFTAWDPVTVASRQMDMSAETAVDFKISIQHGYDNSSLPSEYPDNGEDLVVEYLNNALSWVSLETFSGGGTAGKIFNRTYSLPATALHNAFQVRFRQTSGSGSDWDYWHMDNMCATPPPPPGACDASFSDGLQSHSGGNIRFDNNAFLSGSPDGILDAGSINNANGLSCSSQSADCTVSGTSVSTIDPGAYQTQSGGGNFTVASGGTGTIGTSAVSNYNNMTINSSATLNTTASVTTYKIAVFTAYSGSVINLTAGDYWIDDMYLDQNVTLNVVGSGTVRIFSNTLMWFDKSSIVNGGATGDPSKLLLYSYGDISFRNNTEIAAVVYAQGNVDLRNNAVLKGAMTANDIRLRKNASVIYDDNAVSGTDFGGICTVPATVHHFEMSYTGSALTCSAKAITIKACADALCSTVVSVATTVTPSATGAASTWSQNPVVIPANSTAGVEVNLTHTTPEVVTLSATGVPSATNAVVCTPSCNLEFFEAGFLLSLPDHTSCTAANLSIQAVKMSDTGTSCAPAFTGNQSINFTFNYSNPATGFVVPSLDGTNMAAAGVVQNRTINFDATATATLPFTYNDAGQVAVTVAQGASAGLSPATTSAVVVPAKFIVASPDANASCSSNDAFCNPFFKKAGETFNLNVTAACSDNTVTRNFQMNNIPLSMSTVAPLSGNPVTLGVSSFNMSAGDSGIHAIPNQTVSEVGVFTFSANSVSNGYFGVLNSPAGTSASIGRFIPDHLVVEGNTPLLQDATCNAFTYQDQPFGFNVDPVLTMTAYNTNNVITRNYGGDFWKYALASPVPLPSRIYINQVSPLASTLSTDLSAGSVVLTGTADFDGVGQLTISGDKLTYLKSAVSPVALDAPFTASMKLNVPSAELTDSDGVASVAFSSNNIGNTNIRWGRWFLENAFGPETQPLTVVGQAQYFDGTQFVTNVDDSCTPLTIASVPTLTLSNFTGNLSALDTVLTTPLVPTSGVAAFILSAPGVNHEGTVQLEFSSPSWLQYDFNGDTVADNAKATATFGVFSGKKPVIYWRQSFGN